MKWMKYFRLSAIGVIILLLLWTYRLYRKRVYTDATNIEMRTWIEESNELLKSMQAAKSDSIKLLNTEIDSLERILNHIDSNIVD